MNRQNLFLRMKTVVKLGILSLIIAWFGMDFIVVQPISQTTLCVYTLTMLVCILSFFISLWPKLQKISYVLFSISLIAYLLMYNFVPEIIIQHKIDRCIDKGFVWDGNDQKCREDCWHWSKETGCERK